MSEKREIKPFGMADLYGSGDWQAQERAIAQGCRGRRVAGSGASLYARGDVTSAAFLYEAKMTDKASIRVTWEWLAKIAKQALACGKKPALVFEMKAKDRRDLVVESEWVAVPMSVWRQLIGEDR